MAETFDIENMPKLLTGPNQHLFDIFLLRNSICHKSARISPIDLIYESLCISFWSSFQLGKDLYCEKALEKARQ